MELTIVKRRVWDRRDDESSLSYSAFRVYLDIGPGRTLKAATEKFIQGTDRLYSGTYQQLLRLFQNHGWESRAAAYDVHFTTLEDKRREELVDSKADTWAKRREEIREKKYELAQIMFKQASEMLRFPNAEITIIQEGVSYNVAPAKWSDKSTAATLAKTACELTADMNKVTIEVPRAGEGLPDLSRLSDEELEKFRALLSKATAEEVAS